MKRFAKAALAVAIALAPQWAGAAWREGSTYFVQPVSNGSFEIVGRITSSPNQFWCGAGNYALTKLRTAANQRIYVARTVVPNAAYQGQPSVLFSLTPPPGANTQTGVTLAVDRVGENLSAAQARAYCYDQTLTD